MLFLGFFTISKPVVSVVVWIMVIEVVPFTEVNLAQCFNIGQGCFSWWHGNVHSAGQNAPAMEFLHKIQYLGPSCSYYLSGNAIGIDNFFIFQMLWKTLTCQSHISPDFVRKSNKRVWHLVRVAAAGWKSGAWQVLPADKFPLQSPSTNVRLNKNPSSPCVGVCWQGTLCFRNLLPLWFTERWRVLPGGSISTCSNLCDNWAFCYVNEFYICFGMKLFPEVAVKGLFEMIKHPQVFLKPVNFDCDCDFFVWGGKNNKASFYPYVNLAWWDVLEGKVGWTPLSKPLHYRFQLCGD